LNRIEKEAFYGCDYLTDVYYTGSPDQWKSISIGTYNRRLKDAIIHYNYNGTPDSKVAKGKSVTVSYKKLKKAGIRTCLHIINGLPGESYEDMIATAKELGRLSPEAVKIHLLHINKDTALEKMYLEGKYTPMEKDDYIKIVTDQLMYIPPETVIERLTGDGDRRYLTAPLWSRDKISVLGGIDKRMAEEDILQGKGLNTRQAQVLS
jgi:radical SAM superfamily enzyme